MFFGKVGSNNWFALQGKIGIYESNSSRVVKCRSVDSLTGGSQRNVKSEKVLNIWF